MLLVRVYRFFTNFIACDIAIVLSAKAGNPMVEDATSFEDAFDSFRFSLHFWH